MNLIVLMGLAIPAIILGFLLLLCLKNFEKISFSLKKMRRLGLPTSNVQLKKSVSRERADFNYLDLSGGTLGI